MKYIKIKDQEHLIILNNRVFKTLFVKLGKDVFSSEDDSVSFDWVDDPEVIEFVGYEALKQGCEYNGTQIPYSEKQFKAVLGRVAALEISNYILAELNETAEYVLNNLPKEGKEAEGGK